MSIELTKQYIKAFSSKDITQISLIFDSNIVLEDPVIKRVKGKKNVLSYIESLFNSCQNLEFVAKNIFKTKTGQTIIEFELKVDDTVFLGVDILEWKDSNIVELRAYLDMSE